MKLDYEDYREFIHWMCRDPRNQNAFRYLYEIMTSYGLYEKYCLLPKPEDKLYCIQQLQTSGGFPLTARPLAYIVMERITPNDRRYPVENFVKRLTNKKTNEFLAPLGFRTELTDEFSFTHPLSIFMENSLLFENLVMELSLESKKVERIPLKISDSNVEDFYTDKEFILEDLPFGMLAWYLWDTFKPSEHDPVVGIFGKPLEFWYRESGNRYAMMHPFENILEELKTRVMAEEYDPIVIHKIKGEVNEVQ